MGMVDHLHTIIIIIIMEEVNLKRHLLLQIRGGTSRFELRHALACTINCVLLAIAHAYKCSWQLKPRYSHYFVRDSEGLSRSKGLLFEDKYHGAEDRAQLRGYIVQPLITITVDAFIDCRKYCLLIYISQ